MHTAHLHWGAITDGFLAVSAIISLHSRPTLPNVKACAGRCCRSSALASSGVHVQQGPLKVLQRGSGSAHFLVPAQQCRAVVLRGLNYREPGLHGPQSQSGECERSTQLLCSVHCHLDAGGLARAARPRDSHDAVRLEQRQQLRDRSLEGHSGAGSTEEAVLYDVLLQSGVH